MWSCPPYLKIQNAKWGKNMYNNLYGQSLIVKSAINSNRQYYADKMKKRDYKLDKLMAMVKNMIDQIQIYNSSSDKMDLPKSQDPITMVSSNKNAPPL